MSLWMTGVSGPMDQDSPYGHTHEDSSRGLLLSTGARLAAAIGAEFCGMKCSENGMIWPDQGQENQNSQEWNAVKVTKLTAKRNKGQGSGHSKQIWTRSGNESGAIAERSTEASFRIRSNAVNSLEIV